MRPTFPDRLAAAVRRAGHPLCAGLDPVVERLPADLVASCLQRHGGGLAGAAHALEEFSMRVMDGLVGQVAAVKVQVACFEAYGEAGVGAFERVARGARDRGFIVIGDVKRGDVGVSSDHYARGYLGQVKGLDGADLPGLGLDAITLSPYVGADGLEPFIEACRHNSAGLFVLVRTSNPGSGVWQSAPEDSVGLADRVAAQLEVWNQRLMASTPGYGPVGAVMGATHPKEALRLRELCPRSWLLVPGVGAQGATMEAVAALADPEGLGVLITVSRGLIFAHEKRAAGRIEEAVREEALVLVRELQVAREGAR